jgi:hypothetical protein
MRTAVRAHSRCRCGLSHESCVFGLCRFAFDRVDSSVTRSTPADSARRSSKTGRTVIVCFCQRSRYGSFPPSIAWGPGTLEPNHLGFNVCCNLDR